MIDFDTRTSHAGPVFDARGPHYMTRAADDGSEEVAYYVQRRHHRVLRAATRVWTGRYAATTYVAQAGPGWVYQADTTPYARWLEGTGSMNFPATRFRGYRKMQQVTNEVRVRVAAVAWPAIRPWVRRLGGR